MSTATRRAYAIANRTRAVELTPWARAAVGDTSGWVLPPGYTIMGGGRSAKGPFHLVVRRPSVPFDWDNWKRGMPLPEDRTIAERHPMFREAREAFGELVEQAWAHANGGTE